MSASKTFECKFEFSYSFQSSGTPKFTTNKSFIINTSITMSKPGGLRKGNVLGIRQSNKVGRSGDSHKKQVMVIFDRTRQPLHQLPVAN